MSVKLSTLVVAGALLVSPVFVPQADAQVTAQSGKYLFRLGYKKGQTMKYSITTKVMNAPGMTQPMTTVMPLTMKVVDVQKDVITIQSTVDMSKLQPGAKPQSQTIKMDRLGNVVGGGSSSGMMSGANLPKNPVAVGGTWKTTGNASGFAATSTYKLVGVKQVGARKVANVTMSIVGTGSMKMTGTGTMLLDMADASLVSMAMNMNMPNTQGKGAPITMNMTMTRN